MRSNEALGKLFLRFEIKSLITTLLTLTLIANTKSTYSNKRIFTSYGNATSLFIQMGAYLIFGNHSGTPSFAIIGLSSKPIQIFGKPWYTCEWTSNHISNLSMRAKAIKILPDWGYGRVYTTVVVNCTFPVNSNEDNSGGKLDIYAYYGKSTKKYEKIEAFEEALG
ncbi:hypothetical protein MKX01_014969, partial [Papaver californicum]